ncbi:MAG: iron ABC transporter permease [Rubellimicrobium sp.]|nr:iron ABC transporter permease [Rubellimicrobium sp.]
MRAWEVGWSTAAGLVFRPRVWRLLVNTLSIAATVGVLATVVATTGAWLVERTDLPGRRLWNVLLTLPYAVPAFVAGYSWVSLFPKVSGFWGAVLVLTLSYYPLVYLPVAAALRNMDPALEEVSRSLGFGRRRSFVQVILPSLRPALLGGALLVVLHLLAEFGTFAFLNYATFTTAIFDQYTVAFNGAAAAMLALVLLVLCVAVLALEMLVRGFARYDTIRRGGNVRAERVRLGRAAPFVTLGLVAFSLVALGVPFGSLIYWLSIGRSASLPVAELLRTLTATAGLGIGGAVVAVFFALMLVIYALRYGGIGALLADRLPYMIHAMPGLVVGLAFVFFAVRFAMPLYQSAALLIAAYAILFLPLAQAPIRGVLAQIPRDLEEVAQSMGRGPLAILWRITLPLALPGVGAGFALVCMKVMNELTATLVLRPTGVETLATMVWEHTTNARYAASAPYAMLLILISGVPVYLLTMRSAMRGDEGAT